MYAEEKIWIGQSGEKKISIIPKMANRHGLIAGATGTGKTITLKVLAESFSDGGVPVFLADAKGDVAGMCQPGVDSEGMQKRIAKFGLEKYNFTYKPYPVTFWDVYSEKGISLRTTISEMGPLLLGKLLELNDTQADILTAIFHIADDAGLLLIDLKDLRSMLQYVSEHTEDYTARYGNMPKQSIGAIVRSLIRIEEQGGEQFFGEPALDIRDWFKTGTDGRGMINILDCQKLMNSPEMYATFMLWMVTELFELLPEAGDAQKPKMVFFFDEAHMLFDSAPKAFLEKIQQVVKLIRSKGVGIYFVTQNPSDIPDEVLGQLGNRIQHALRAYTPADQKALKAAAESFRENPEFKTIEVLPELGIGEALVSLLDEEGKPTIVERTKILPPQSRMAAITEEERTAVLEASPLKEKYFDAIDRDSAYEFLNRKTQEEAAAAEKEKAMSEQEKQKAEQEKILAKAEEQKKREEAKEEERKRKEEEREEARKKKEEEKRNKKVESVVNKTISATMGTIGREVSKNLVRGLFKNLKLFK